MSQSRQRVGVVGKPIFYAGSDLSNNNAGFHNSLYRGKKLGTSVSADQYAAISSVTIGKSTASFGALRPLIIGSVAGILNAHRITLLWFRIPILTLRR